MGWIYVNLVWKMVWASENSNVWLYEWSFACKNGLDWIGFRWKFFKLSIAKLSGLREKELKKKITFWLVGPSMELRVVGENFDKYRCYSVGHR